MKSGRRVVVTGMGTISPLGLDTSSLWNGFMACRSGIGPITRFDVEKYTSRIAGEVKNFDPEKWIPKKEIRRMDRFIHYAVAASDEAMADANLTVEDEIAHRVGSVIGVGIGGLESIEIYRDVVVSKGPRRISPYFIPMLISNLAPGQISMRHNAKGPTLTTTSACSSASHALGDSMRWIQRGVVDVMITGGAEAAITPLGVGGFTALKALTTTRNDNPESASRPFDKDRDGFVIAEGAGILILEELEFAKARGAHIYAEITGYGATSDAYHMTAPDPDGAGAVRCMEECLKDAEINPGDVQYINAHGTSTPINDPIETAAIKKVFGDHAYKLAVSSTKSMTGHLLGAAGAVEAIASIKAIEHQIAPPTINLDNPDPACDLDYVPNEPRSIKVDNTISNSLGFGGTNATIAISRFTG